MTDIIAIVATKDNKDNLSGGKAVFWAADEAEAAKKALYLARIFKAMVHDLEGGIYLIVAH